VNINWSEFLSFRQMVTPVIIQVLFWLGVAGTVLAGLVALGDSPGSGLALIILGPLIVRIYCELLIILFRMHESLRNIERSTVPAPAAAPPAPMPPAPMEGA
jgi:hypothetical protein